VFLVLAVEVRRLLPGEVVALVAVGGVLAADVVLIRKGHDPVSTCVRRNPHARRVVRALSAHLVDEIPGDLLTWAGRFAVRRTVDAVTP
jgi:hypothetical protein